MKASKARIKANARYNQKAYEIITFRAQKSLYLNKLIEVAAQKAGKSKAQYMLEAIQKQLCYDGITIECLDQIEPNSEMNSDEVNTD